MDNLQLPFLQHMEEGSIAGEADVNSGVTLRPRRGWRTVRPVSSLMATVSAPRACVLLAVWARKIVEGHGEDSRPTDTESDDLSHVVAHVAS